LLRAVGILPEQYAVSEPKEPDPETSMPWNPQISHQRYLT